MASGMDNPTFPMSIREFINFLRRRHNLSMAQGMPTVYALLASGAIAEETYALRFLDTQVAVKIPLEELDGMVRQFARGEAGSTSTSIASPEVSPGGLQLVATVPPGLAISGLSNIESIRSTFARIVSSAKETLRISSPYIEQPGLNLILGSFETAAKNGAWLRLLVRIDDSSNPEMRKVMAVLTLHEIFGQKLEVRSFAKVIGQGQYWLSLGGVHAKLLLADKLQAYVGSGEIRDHSLNRNFELGFAVDDPAAINLISGLFDAVWDVSSNISVEYCRAFVK
ncbi:MAG: hypothetical protein KJ077_07605 [Anaerolineae bacterium]|nr:hypothetical protein [Anaerolineae bacterium]